MSGMDSLNTESLHQRGLSYGKPEHSGYTYGSGSAARSPLTSKDPENLKEAVLFTEEDERYLRMAGQVLADQVEDVLDVWYGFVASHPHLCITSPTVRATLAWSI